MPHLTVSDLMSKDICSIQPHETLARLNNLLIGIHIRHVPVVDEERNVIGLLEFFLNSYIQLGCSTRISLLIRKFYFIENQEKGCRQGELITTNGLREKAYVSENDLGNY